MGRKKQSGNLAEAWLEETAVASAEATPKGCRPFVKWAGGKAQMLPELLKRVPAEYFRYFEPFAGGAALYFRLQPQRATLFEINAELVNVYCVLKAQVDLLIADLRRHVYDSDYYYKLREADRGPDFTAWSALKRASRFLYLNRTCYNGLYRVNSKGHCNTPFGRYVNPKIVDEENLRACARVLQNTYVAAESYEVVLDEARRGDFVYFDPPYHPRTRTADFTNYTAGGFGPVQQQQLKDLFTALDQQGVKILLSNSATPFIEDLYREYRIEHVLALRAINSKGDSRGRIDEVLIRNY